MKYTSYIKSIIAAIIVGLLSVSCTQNNGDIGEWFGEWKLCSIEINNELDRDYNNDVLWKFQNNIIEMVVVNSVGHSHSEHYGTWISDAGMITLNFTHSDDLNTAGNGKYSPPQQTHLPAAIIDLKILKLSSSEIILQYEASADCNIIYTLRKRG